MAVMALELNRTSRRNSCPGNLKSMAVQHDTCPTMGTDARPRASSERLKAVRFGTVEVREHEYILGCQACESDIPLTIAWHASSTVTLDLDDYEAHRQTKSAPINLQNQPVDRWERLERMGFGLDEVKEAKAHCDSIRQHESQVERERKYESEVIYGQPTVPYEFEVSSRRGSRRGFFHRILQRPSVFKKRGPAFDDN